MQSAIFQLKTADCSAGLKGKDRTAFCKFFVPR